MGCASVFVTFKIENEDFLSVKGKDERSFLKVNDRDNYRNIIRWDPIFNDYLKSSYGSRRKLTHVLREHSNLLDEVSDPPFPSWHYDESGNLIFELEHWLPHGRPIFKNDKDAVYVNVEETSREELA